MKKNALLTLIPLLVVALLLVMFANRLADPRAAGAIDSPLIGQAVPPSLGITAKPPYIINLFASWCAPCAAENPHLLEMKNKGATIVGIAYKDMPEKIATYLKAAGNPYARVIYDEAGDAGITLGITGVPESFAVDRDGVIRARLQGGFATQIEVAAFMEVLK